MRARARAIETGHAMGSGPWSRRNFVGCVAVAVLLGLIPGAAAQDPLMAARDLYRAAEYEDALARLNSLRASGHVTTETRYIEQYRAFCLLALGRMDEAQRAIEAVVTASPTFRPSEAEESPRIRSAFREVRQRVLPGIIQQQYAEAKAAFDRNDAQAAVVKFQQVIDLLGDADIAPSVTQPPLSEIRTLATGFRDLSAKTVAQKTAAALPSAMPVTAESARTPGPLAAAPGSRAGEAAAPVEPRVYSIQDAGVVTPVVLRESWAGLGDVFAVRTGVVTVIIDEAGEVERAVMTVPVNPVYDRLAISTAKNWKYRPALLNGVPVKFRKVILLDVKATR